jgi:AcrR family transcriptional regulator
MTSALPARERSALSPPAARKAQTQERILRAAMELFATRGYHRTSTSQIAQRAGVSRASIFWHFSDKATLFDATARHFLVPFRRALGRGRALPSARARILHQVDAYDAFVREHRATLRAFLAWIFTAQPHAASLRRELLALHRDFHAGLSDDLAEVLGGRGEAAATASLVAAALHGDLLLSLGGESVAPPSALSVVKDLLAERVEAPAGPPRASRPAGG